MKTAVISYSLTGNNDALAERIARGLKAEHMRITEAKKRTNGTIAADILFRRTPLTEPGPQVMPAYDLVLFVAPVWMGQPAFPLRSYLRYLKEHPQKYAFVACSGGGPNGNPGLAGALKKGTGMEPAALVDLHIGDLLPPDPKPSAQAVSAYRLTAEDVEKLAGRAIALLREKLPDK